MKHPLIVERLNKTMGNTHIIKDMSFALERGQIYGFLGPNGSGKTTTIRMIVSLIAADSGEVKIEGKSIRTEREEALPHIGAIVEDPDLYLYLTGKQNLIHYANMSVKPISRERINDVAKLVELDDAINKKVKTYSLGMKQRLGIAVSLLHEPSVLILDEPTNGLDPKGMRDLRDYLRRLARENGVTLFISSHQLSEVEMLCDRAIIIKDGHVVDEVDMSRSRSEEELYTIRLEVAPHAVAKKVLEAFGHVKSRDGELVIEKQRHTNIPSMIQALIEAGVDVFATNYQQRLEDAYFDLTEEKKERVS
ncbi:ABC transporter ATP-binding protein [Shouchella lonarensis]|uniref:ABC-2 type transport system ATP-binding protein n=1 Tax=Shouchella lonarensis TaxID=1464122 RepID=A0A1G6GIY7_9BACI|nr:ABC transporter ATP-binding protein [Shouchella lonarensis]SDB81982.1 ABC-2 type transport system ATP-binding protein [Shouchella lonarensis]